MFAQQYDMFFSFQSQLTVIKAQQDRIESNNDVINKMKTDLSTSNGNLKKLKGKELYGIQSA